MADLKLKKLNGKWEAIDPLIHDLYNLDKSYPSDIFSNRDYTLFSILEADHPRNYNNVESIAPERGIPKDSDWYDYLDYPNYWGQSYVTFNEIYNFKEKHPMIEQQGYVSKEDYQKLKTGEITEPNMYWQDGSPSETQYHATWTTISPIVDLCGYLTYIFRIYQDQCVDYIYNHNDSDKTTQKYHQWLNTLGESIRLVFAFDN